jgi:hypothetical protein
VNAAADFQRVVTLGLSALDTALIHAIVGGGSALAALSLWYLG